MDEALNGSHRAMDGKSYPRFFPLWQLLGIFP